MRRVLAPVVALAAIACSQQTDRTPPTVVWRTPAAGDTSAFVGGGFVATFSEDLDPATVNVGTVHVTLAGEPIAATVWLRDDRTVTVRPAVAVVDHGEIAVELTSGIADLAGNPFAGDAAPWTFEAPGWARIGAPVSPAYAVRPLPSLAVTGGEVIVGMGGTLGTALAASWDGAEWNGLPPPWPGATAGRVSASNAFGLWVAGTAAGAPWAACAGTGGWRALAPPATTGDAIDAWWIAHRPEPYLAWLELRQADGLWLVAAGWDGRNGWTHAGEWQVPGPDVQVAAAPEGAAYGAWIDAGEVHVIELAPDGRAFSPPPVTASAGSLSLAAGVGGWPVVALHDPEAGIVVAEWDGVWEAWGSWNDVLALPPAGAAVQTALAFPEDPRLGRVVAWAAPDDASAGAPRRVHLTSRLGGVLQQHGPLNAAPDRDVAALALMVVGQTPLLAWAEDAGVSLGAEPLYRFQVARLNSSPASVGGALPVETYDPRYDGACDRLPPVRPPR